MEVGKALDKRNTDDDFTPLKAPFSWGGGGGGGYYDAWGAKNLVPNPLEILYPPKQSHKNHYPYDLLITNRCCGVFLSSSFLILSMRASTDIV